MEVTEFWHQVIEGYNQVAIERGRTINIKRDGKSATVVSTPNADLVVISIQPAKTETVEPLPVP